MKALRVQVGVALALLACSLPAHAQLELITIERPLRASNLAGIVVDPTGAPVSGAVVEDCDALFSPILARGAAGEPAQAVLQGDCDRDPKHVLGSTETDANGHFVFPRANLGTTHYLHLSCRGFDPMQITVKLRFFARPRVRIKLHIAN
jgi:hypothetical protein